jgi:uncharacterized protein YbaR (Trm112 family)
LLNNLYFSPLIRKKDKILKKNEKELRKKDKILKNNEKELRKLRKKLKTLEKEESEESNKSEESKEREEFNFNKCPFCKEEYETEEEIIGVCEFGHIICSNCFEEKATELIKEGKAEMHCFGDNISNNKCSFIYSDDLIEDYISIPINNSFKRSKKIIEKEKQEKEKEKDTEKEKVKKEEKEIEKTIEIKSKSPEEEKRANIFDGICPHCKKKSEGMEKGNVRKCNYCELIYDIQNNFKEYTREEWITKNKPSQTKEEVRIENILNGVCPNCKRKLEGIGKGNSLKCNNCKIVYDILNNFKEYTTDDWKKKIFIK